MLDHANSDTPDHSLPRQSTVLQHSLIAKAADWQEQSHSSEEPRIVLPTVLYDMSNEVDEHEPEEVRPWTTRTSPSAEKTPAPDRADIDEHHDDISRDAAFDCGVALL